MSTLFIASNGVLYADPIHIITGIAETGTQQCILYFLTI